MGVDHETILTLNGTSYLVIFPIEYSASIKIFLKPNIIAANNFFKLARYIVRVLNVDFALPDKFGNTPAFIASRENNTQMLKFIQEQIGSNQASNSDNNNTNDNVNNNNDDKVIACDGDTT